MCPLLCASAYSVRGLALGAHGCVDRGRVTFHYGILPRTKK